MGHNQVVADAAVADAYVDSVNLAGPLDVHQPLETRKSPDYIPNMAKQGYDVVVDVDTEVFLTMPLYSSSMYLRYSNLNPNPGRPRTYRPPRGS